jgi:hypothetical protein
MCPSDNANAAIKGGDETHKFPPLGFWGFHENRIARRSIIREITSDTGCHDLSFVRLKCGVVVVKGMQHSVLDA